MSLLRYSLLTTACGVLLLAGCASHQPIKTPFSSLENSPYQAAYQKHSRNNQLAESAVAQIRLTESSLDPQQQHALFAVLWRNLQNLSADDLTSYVNNPDPLIRGWFQLALITQQNANKPILLVNAIQQWRGQYPRHPANRVIPNNEQLMAATQPERPHQIALLLPLEGPFGGMGNAVRNGFMTAYYANMDELSPKPSIKVYDTTQQDVVRTYLEAIANGAEVVVGPLTKDNVARLSHSGEISIPTIALNYLDWNTTSPPDLIQFGLLPTQSAAQTAEVAWHHGSNRVLMMTPEGDRGNQLAQAFKNSFQYEGGTIAEAITFDTKNFNTQVASVLGVDRSEARAKQLSQMLRKKLAFTPRRRQDVNGIFLAATASQAREIEPFLKFYFAGNLPVYSTSLIYNGHQNRAANRDINGTYFTDIAWLFSQSPYTAQLRAQVKSTWPEDYRQYSRLYGIGIDAFLLTQLFNRILYMPTFGVNGVTGRLYLSPNQQVNRQLVTARIMKGRAMMLNSH